jgi:hypothetical protein
MDDALHGPGFQSRLKQGVKVGNVAFEKGQGIKRENYAKAESSLWWVLLEDIDTQGGKATLNQQSEQESRRPGADDVYLHGAMCSYLAADKTHHEDHEGHEAGKSF